LFALVGKETAVLFGAVWSWVPLALSIVIFILSIFLILLVLIQRGKGGGLAGAFGGVGGSSAFGSRAGDTFTRVTVIVAAVWVLLIMIMVKMIQPAPAVEKPMQTKSQPEEPAQ
jgi:preprotein translocase subunit SecG